MRTDTEYSNSKYLAKIQPPGLHSPACTDQPALTDQNGQRRETPQR